MYKYTRTTSVFLIAIAFSIASTVDASLSPPKVARTSSGEINADHIHNLLRQRRLKSSKGNQGSGSDNDEAKSSKQGNTGTGGGGTATGSDNFNKVINIPILGSGGTISGNPNGGGGGGGGDDGESQDGGGDEVDMTTPNRGDEENTEEMTGGGSDNAGTINAGLDCGKNIPTAGGPNETEECNGSCECQDSCCIQHVARFCAPRGDNGMSTFGGGFMPCI